MTSAKKSTRDIRSHDLFPELPKPTGKEVLEALKFLPLQRPVWTHQKARLIERYLHYFVMVTKHGTYIDGFAGPQSPDNPETWAAKLVIESQPRFLRNFFFCELDSAKVEALKTLSAKQPPLEKKEPKRRCAILPGDFNTKVDEILASGMIREKEATFALLDQWTYECHWASVVKLARHKKEGNKIELFYFLAMKWLHRSMGGVSTPEGEERVNAWWGRDDWRSLRNMTQENIRDVMCERFRRELGYRHAYSFPIWEEEDSRGAVMYYMIHATDHREAPKLMHRAYRHVHPNVCTAEQLGFDAPGFEKPS
jgi:three-Cys-motif partner protein